ncbi:FtsX-like permease family protein [Micromonospora sp. NPDC050495]|uniref:ABC transporter permease n=1 Tax=Micromonospora sp. NPDC050495 TaxID=3154936 RepID=UPI0033E49B01
MFRATLKNLLSRKLRLAMSAMAVVLGVTFVSGTLVLTDTLGRSFDSMFSSIYSDTDVGVTGGAKVEVSEVDGGGAPTSVPASLIDTVAAVPGVAQVTGVVSVDGVRVVGGDGKVIPSVGAPRLGESWTEESALIRLREGRGPSAPDEVAINASLAAVGDFAVGDSIDVLTREPRRSFRLVGIFGYSGDRDSLGGTMSVAFTQPVAQRLMLGSSDVFSSLNVRAADGVEPAELRDRVRQAVGGGYDVKTGAELADEAAAGFRDGLAFFSQILLGFAAVALFVGIFLILNTFSIIAAQRTREMALLRSIGASRRQVMLSVLGEATVIGLIAAVLGLATGVGAGAGLAYLVSRYSGGLTLAGLSVPPAAVAAAFGVGVVVTVVAAVVPALRASRVPPIAAMRDAAGPDRPLTRLATVGALITGVGAVLLVLGLTAVVPGAMVAVLLGVLASFIGVALLTPVLSRPAVALLGRAFAGSLPGKLGRLNAGRNLRRTAITSAALMVGIALITAVSVVLGSASESIRGLASGSLRADLVVRGEQTGLQQPGVRPEVFDQVATLPGVSAAAAVYRDQALVNGDQRFVTVINDLGALTEVFGLRPVQGDPRRLGPGDIVVDQDHAADLGLSLGSRVAIQFAKGQQRTYTVTAVYPESDLPGGMALPKDAAQYLSAPTISLGYVQLADGVPVDQVKPRIEALLADDPEVSVVDLSSFADQQTESLDQVRLMIQLLLGLAIVIAILGVVNTLALSVIERVREIGLLRAVGLNRTQTIMMIVVEAVIISLFGALLGVVVGGGLGVAAVQGLEEQGINELVVPWGQMAIYFAGAGVVGVFAAILPALRAARTDVLGAIATP